MLSPIIVLDYSMRIGCQGGIQAQDGIQAQKTARQIVPSLTVLFNNSLSTGVLPSDWNMQDVVPIHKKPTNSL